MLGLALGHDPASAMDGGGGAGLPSSSVSAPALAAAPSGQAADASSPAQAASSSSSCRPAFRPSFSPAQAFQQHQQAEAAIWKRSLRYQVDATARERFMASTCTIEAGTILHHGTSYTLQGAWPAMEVNYFSTDLDQSRAHALHRFDPHCPERPRVHTYRVKRPIPHVLDLTPDFELGDAFRLLAIDKRYHPTARLGTNNELLGYVINLEREQGTWPIQGVRHLHDQFEVQLAQPERYLELIGVETFAGVQRGGTFDPFGEPVEVDPGFGPQGVSVGPWMSPAQLLAHQRQSRSFRRWKAMMEDCLNVAAIRFGPSGEGEAHRDLYEYAPERHGHLWKRQAQTPDEHP